MWSLTYHRMLKKRLVLYTSHKKKRWDDCTTYSILCEQKQAAQMKLLLNCYSRRTQSTVALPYKRIKPLCDTNINSLGSCRLHCTEETSYFRSPGWRGKPSHRTGCNYRICSARNAGTGCPAPGLSCLLSWGRWRLTLPGVPLVVRSNRREKKVDWTEACMYSTKRNILGDHSILEFGKGIQNIEQWADVFASIND